MLATTTPYDLVKPLADALGFDDVVATRYGEKDGVYDGTLDGEFVWGPGKLRAIAEWAMENAVDLGESWAYSDSYYDIPMLSAVRHPVVVNPDPRLLVAGAGAAVAGRAPRRARRACRSCRWSTSSRSGPLLAAGPARARSRTPRFDIAGVEHIPKEGAGDRRRQPPQLLRPDGDGLALAKRGRPVRFLGKKEVFDAPVVGQLARAMGGIRVERGTGLRRAARGGRRWRSRPARWWR